VLLVDEAHAVGTLGAGRGLTFELGLAAHPQLVQTATLSKALGSQGGVVGGPKAVRDFLITRARTFGYDTGLALPSVAAARAAAQIVLEEPHRVSELRGRVQQIAQGLGVRPPDGAVISIGVRSADHAVRIRDSARAHGVVVGAFRPPSVPDGRSRVRVTASCELRPDQVEHACSVLKPLIGSEP
jgi:8-amino-7-oxononanoate synthase